MPEQPNLFTEPKHAGVARTLRRFAAETRGEGIVAAQACEGNAARRGFDPEAAGNCILVWLKRHGPTSGETLTNIAKGEGHLPHDDRAYGGVFVRLLNRKLIRQVGTTERAKGHGTAGARVWEAVVECVPMEHRVEVPTDGPTAHGWAPVPGAAVGKLSVAVDNVACANPVANANQPQGAGNFQVSPADRRGTNTEGTRR